MMLILLYIHRLHNLIDIKRLRSNIRNHLYVFLYSKIRDQIIKLEYKSHIRTSVLYQFLILHLGKRNSSDLKSSVIQVIQASEHVEKC